MIKHANFRKLFIAIAIIIYGAFFNLSYSSHQTRYYAFYNHPFFDPLYVETQEKQISGIWESKVVSPEAYQLLSYLKRSVAVVPPRHINKNTKLLVILPAMPHITEPTSIQEELITRDIANIFNTLILIPQVPKGEMWFADNLGSSTDHFDWLAQRLLPWAEAEFNVEVSRENTFIAGYSKTGLSALNYMIKYRNTFGYAIIHDTPFELSYGEYNNNFYFENRQSLEQYLPKQLFQSSALHHIDSRIVLVPGRIFGKDLYRYIMELTNRNITFVLTDKYDEHTMRPVIDQLPALFKLQCANC